MRDLRARLNEISVAQASGQTSARRAEPVSDACYVREMRVPLGELPGLLTVTREQLMRIDKGFDPAATDVRRFLFLDTETTGLGMGAGTVAFLLGLGFVDGDDFVVRQLLMRDYPEEPLLLQHYFDLLPRFDAFVTFNGKSFDLPLLQNRLIMHRMRDTAAKPHLDLLYPTRRVWRMRLKDCTLGNIERQVLGCGREDDLPGSLVPERFFHYLKVGDFSLLEDVLRHNLLDIITLGKLLVALARVFDQPEQQSFAEDIFSAGRSLARDGQRGLARRCFQVASVGALSEQARVHLALAHRGDRQFAEATAVYQQMIASGQGGLMPYIELAKIAEHRARDYAGALTYTEAAMARLTLRQRLGGEVDAQALCALERRQQRLIKKLAR